MGTLTRRALYGNAKIQIKIRSADDRTKMSSSTHLKGKPSSDPYLTQHTQFGRLFLH